MQRRGRESQERKANTEDVKLEKSGGAGPARRTVRLQQNQQGRSKEMRSEALAGDQSGRVSCFLRLFHTSMSFL